MATRKYDPEALKQRALNPKPRGQPRKYHTEEERAAARRAAVLRYYHRSMGHDDPSYAIQLTKYATEEERREGKRAAKQRYIANHHDEYKLTASASAYRARHLATVE